MKRGTPGHPKMRALANALDIRLHAAVGLLELLWHITMRYAPAGNIGKFTNAALAEELDWLGDADLLVQSLVATGWLDECTKHRLIVHDWPDHADQTAQRYLKAHGIPWAKQELKPSSKNASNSANEVAKADSLPEPVPEPVPQPEPRDNGEFDRFWSLYPVKKSKKAARKAWGMAVKTTDAETLITAIVSQEAERKAALSRNEFAPYPAHASTWLNGERWKDEVELDTSLFPPRDVTAWARTIIDMMDDGRYERLSDAEKAKYEDDPELQTEITRLQEAKV